MRTNRLILTILLLTISTSLSFAQTLAFPEADGYGRFTTGGRGGKVYVVTSLADDGSPGTLRHAVSQSGSRYIVFAVSGVIELEKTLSISNDDITIAGQTSPGGICLKGKNTYIKAGNVIIRYLRFRLGYEGGHTDAITSINSDPNVIIDHCSFSWASDDNTSLYSKVNFTMQYCIVSECLEREGYTSYGGIWGGSGASYHHNLITNHTGRAPRMCHPEFNSYPNSESLSDLRNNVVYNWGWDMPIYGNEDSQFNMVNCYFKEGPANRVSGNDLFFTAYSGSNGGYGSEYINGNFYEGNPTISADNVKGVEIGGSNFENNPFTPTILPKFSQQDYVNSLQTPQEAYDLLVTNSEVGANRNAYGVFHDMVDTRVINEVATGTTTYGDGIIDSELKVISSWDSYHKNLQQNSAKTDNDLDGMPDEWESQKGVSNPNGYDLDPNYTNIEVYCNEIGAFGASNNDNPVVDITKPYSENEVLEDDNRKRIILYFNETLQENSIPSTSDFTISHNKQVQKITIKGSEIYLDVDSDFQYGDKISLSYSKGTTPLVDLAGNETNSFKDYSIENKIIEGNNTTPSDNVKPFSLDEVVEEVNPQRIILIFSEPLQENSLPSPSDFTLNLNKEVLNVSINGSEIYLDVDSEYVDDDDIKISYSVGTNPILDLSGNSADSFSNYTVENNAPERVITNDETITGGIKIDMNVFPNPTDGIITLQANNLNGETSIITIYSILGKQIEELVFNNSVESLDEQINLSHIKNGIYILKLSCGKQISQTKIIIR